MNWTNYKLLVEDLKQLPPDRFDYSTAARVSCGCVAIQIYKREYPACNPEAYIGPVGLLASTIERFLGVTHEEADYLYGNHNQQIEPGSIRVCHGGSFSGERGIREALRRLDVVAARYGGEPPPAPSAWTPKSDSQFLADLRSAIFDHPVAVEQE